MCLFPGHTIVKKLLQARHNAGEFSSWHDIGGYTTVSWWGGQCVKIDTNKNIIFDVPTERPREAHCLTLTSWASTQIYATNNNTFEKRTWVFDPTCTVIKLQHTCTCMMFNTWRDVHATYLMITAVSLCNSKHNQSQQYQRRHFIHAVNLKHFVCYMYYMYTNTLS